MTVPAGGGALCVRDGWPTGRGVS
ncbi:protein of unknown function [Streptomyces murinus]